MRYNHWGRAIDGSSLGPGLSPGKPLRKSVGPFGGDLWFGWLGSLGLFLDKPLGCVSTLWKWMPAGKDFYHALQQITYID